MRQVRAVGQAGKTASADFSASRNSHFPSISSSPSSKSRTSPWTCHRRHWSAVAAGERSLWRWARYSGRLASGLLDLTAGRLDSAVEHFKQAIKVDDKLVDAYYYMADAYFKNHQTAAAKEALAHCLDLDPTHQKAIALRAALEGADPQRRK